MGYNFGFNRNIFQAGLELKWLKFQIYSLLFINLFFFPTDRPKERLEAVRKEVEIRDDLERTPSDSQDGSGASRRGQENGVKVN